MRSSNEALLKHARKYGTEGIAETAIELGTTLSELTSLLVELDKLEQAGKPRITQRHKKINIRAVCEARAKKLLGIEDEKDEAA